VGEPVWHRRGVTRTMFDDERQPWESEGDASWASSVPGWEPAEDEDFWRGDVHPELQIEAWPEDLAGPEYWLYKKLGDDEA
jgi:hypothetical protein